MIPESKMHLVITFIAILAVSACLPLKQSAYLAPFVKEKPLLVLPRAKSVEISGEKITIKAENRAVVPYFEVIFYDENSPIAPKMGAHKEEINSKLIGVSHELLQRITDQAYLHFIDEMKTQGIEILPISSLGSSQTYQQFSTEGIERLEKTVFGPGATSVLPSGMKSSGSKESRGKQISKIMDEMNASVMNITLYVTHMIKSLDQELNTSNNLPVEQKIAVIKGSRMQFFGLKASKCEGYCPSSVVNAKLGQSIYSPEDVGDLVRKNTEIKKNEAEEKISVKHGDLKSQAIDLSMKAVDLGEKAVDWVAALSKNEVDASVYELRADPVKYEKVVSETLLRSTKKLVKAITYHQLSDK
ncbi:MAG: hypothetical protein ACJA2R_000354 [Saprospiraceae bacterium]|jgi:hypothetical protein